MTDIDEVTNSREARRLAVGLKSKAQRAEGVVHAAQKAVANAERIAGNLAGEAEEIPALRAAAKAKVDAFEAAANVTVPDVLVAEADTRNRDTVLAKAFQYAVQGHDPVEIAEQVTAHLQQSDALWPDDDLPEAMQREAEGDAEGSFRDFLRARIAAAWERLGAIRDEAAKALPVKQQAESGLKDAKRELERIEARAAYLPEAIAEWDGKVVEARAVHVAEVEAFEAAQAAHEAMLAKAEELKAQEVAEAAPFVDRFKVFRVSLDDGLERADFDALSRIGVLAGWLVVDGDVEFPLLNRDQGAPAAPSLGLLPGEWDASVVWLEPGDLAECYADLVQTGESLAVLVARIAVPAETMERRLSRLANVGHRLDLFPMVFAPEEVDRSGSRYAVEGMLPFGALAMLAGEGGVGKTSAAHALLMAAGSSTGPKEFLGQLVTGTYPVALITGEESEEEIADRQAAFGGTWGEPNLKLRAGSGPAFYKSALAAFEELDEYGVLVVDSVTSLAGGSHIDGAEVARFLQPLKDFAQRKKWAVLVLHHFSQGRGALLDRISGSRAFINLPRMVMALEAMRDGRRKVTTVKHNLLPGQVWLPKDQSRLFSTDDATLRLMPIEDAAVANDEGEADIEPRVLAAIARVTGEGVRVNKSGKSGLHKLNAPEVAGIGRNALEAAIGGLIDDGELAVTGNGLFVVRPEGGEAEAA
ncbi:AAA family ATPase [Sphingomonas sp. RB56-2]|uniref:AAA family ATPase n=1 Tax=Sphingomonas brevis TaxID=2908206 RepID=A0ABT0S9W0_9SPHN|nr:AAA family ATPase [Sphingomonas brevis]MCL6741158.1 AAA family ATPase [Sphingomonas brevis]